MHTKDTNAQKHTPLQHDLLIFNCIVSFNVNSTLYLMKYMYGVAMHTKDNMSIYS